MSDKMINVIITLIVIISIIVAFLLMYYSPKKDNQELQTNNKEVDKIAIFNEEIDRNIDNAIGHFTVSMENYELNNTNININFNVKKVENGTFIIENILLNDEELDVNLGENIIDFELGTIKEDKKSTFLYITTNKGAQDGEGDVVIINNSGNILYQNKKAYLEELDDEKYLVKEKYCDLLTSLSCEANNLDDLAFKNITYKSINSQLVNIEFEELTIGDVCYN